MGLDSLIKAGVAMAKRATRGLQVVVVHRPAATVASDGTVTPGAAVRRRAIVELVVRRLQGPDGVERVSRATVTFLDDVVIAEPDSLVLPDGSTGPILIVEKLLAPGGGGYVTTVWLGA